MKLVSKLKSIFGTVRRKVSGFCGRLFASPAACFKGGRHGGMILCGLLSGLSLYGMILYDAACVFPAPLLIAASVAVCFAGIELLGLVMRLLFGSRRRGLVYFLTAAVMVTATAVIAQQGNGILPALLFGASAALAAYTLGCCAWSIIAGKRLRSAFNWTAGSISLAALVAFAVLLSADGFGSSRADEYLSMLPEAERPAAAEGFSEYLQNGKYTVRTLDYDSVSGADVVTEPVDISLYCSREGVFGSLADKYFDYSLDAAPVKGRVWYPDGAENCPALFIVHGNHMFDVDSYLGYDYLGEYLASCGYVVVSVDENSCNVLSNENDARAVLLLENIEAILAANDDADSPVRGLIDPERIAIAGHSRGGEMAATAYLFNGLDAYPDNGNIRFDYHFNIRAVAAIAPCVDQYMPADRAVKLEDVDYLLIHGMNDQDVSSLCGEKQYNNIAFTTSDSDARHFKASVYLMDANHGQFNTLWGQYDVTGTLSAFLNTGSFLAPEDQQTVARAYIRVFLDETLLGGGKYTSLLWEPSAYAEFMPRTLYIPNYQSSRFVRIAGFDGDADIVASDAMDGAKVRCHGMDNWSEQLDCHGSGGDGENFVLHAKWSERETPYETAYIEAGFPAADLSDRRVSFRMANMLMEGEPLHCDVTLFDIYGARAVAESAVTVLPAPGVQLYKSDVLTGDYEYKTQMETYIIDKDEYEYEEDFDITQVRTVRIAFTGAEKGEVILDEVGME